MEISQNRFLLLVWRVLWSPIRQGQIFHFNDYRPLSRCLSVRFSIGLETVPASNLYQESSDLVKSVYTDPNLAFHIKQVHKFHKWCQVFEMSRNERSPGDRIKSNDFSSRMFIINLQSRWVSVLHHLKQSEIVVFTR